MSDGASRPPLRGRDDLTLAHGLHYLETERPRFLFLVLDETDSRGHQSDYEGYLDAMSQYDLWLRYLDRLLSRMGRDGAATSLLITTDHGRGRGGYWDRHWLIWPGTQEIWLYARGPGIRNAGAIAGCRTFSHADVAPTMEHVLGLEPTAGFLRGEVIEELFEERRC